jgi:hypothetical protein
MVWDAATPVPDALGSSRLLGVRISVHSPSWRTTGTTTVREPRKLRNGRDATGGAERSAPYSGVRSALSVKVSTRRGRLAAAAASRSPGMTAS